MCYEDRLEQKTLRQYLKKARAQEFNAKIKGNKLVINEEIYTVGDLEKLEDELIESGGSDIQETDSEEESATDNKNNQVNRNREKNKNKQEVNQGTTIDRRNNRKKTRKSYGGMISTRSKRDIKSNK